MSLELNTYPALVWSPQTSRRDGDGDFYDLLPQLVAHGLPPGWFIFHPGLRRQAELFLEDPPPPSGMAGALRFMPDWGPLPLSTLRGLLRTRPGIFPDNGLSDWETAIGGLFSDLGFGVDFASALGAMVAQMPLANTWEEGYLHRFVALHEYLRPGAAGDLTLGEFQEQNGDAIDALFQNLEFQEHPWSITLARKYGTSLLAFRPVLPEVHDPLVLGLRRPAIEWSLGNSLGPTIGKRNYGKLLTKFVDEQEHILKLAIHERDIPGELSRLFLASMAHQEEVGWGKVNPLSAHAVFNQVADAFLSQHKVFTSDRLRLLSALGRCDPAPHPVDLMAVLYHGSREDALYPSVDADRSLCLTVALLESLPNPRPVVTFLGELVCDPLLESPTALEWLTLLEEPVTNDFWALPAPLLIPLLKLPQSKRNRPMGSVESRFVGSRRSRPSLAHLRSTP